jgi:hypothetical protein
MDFDRTERYIVLPASLTLLLVCRRLMAPRFSWPNTQISVDEAQPVGNQMAYKFPFVKVAVVDQLLRPSSPFPEMKVYPEML